MAKKPSLWRSVVAPVWEAVRTKNYGALFQFGLAVVTGNPAFLITGTLTLIAGAVAKPPRTPSAEDRESPTYGFSQWQNRTKGDAILPVVYSGHADGHRVAPIYVQAYATPKGEQEDGFSKVLRANGQGLSGLLAVCEGPIDKLEDVRFNDEPVFEKIVRKRIGIGNGSKTKFVFNAKRAVRESFEVYVGGTLKGWKHQTNTRNLTVAAGSVTRRKWTFRNEEIATDRDIEITVDGAALDTSDETQPRPHVWMESLTELRVNTQATRSKRTVYGITVYTRYLEGATLQHDGKGKWTLIFDTAPASNAAVEVTFLRKMFNGLAIDWRSGAAHQLNIPGFESVRNSVGVSTEMTSTAITKSTENEVDNVVLTMASGTGGFTEYDDEGDRSPVEAQFRIEVKRTTTATGNIFNSWQVIYDPAGKKGSKTASEFRCRGDSISQMFWSFSIRGLLQQYAAKNTKSNTAQRLERDFVRAKYDVRVTRTNTIRNNSSSLVIDNVYWSTYDEVIDEKLSYPGVAMLAFHAAASEKLQGSAPNVTCRVRGIRKVEKWTGSAWTQDADAQGNRVWAVIDLLTDRRYGAGDFFTKAANIDTTSALAAANYLDATDDAWDGPRSRLDIVLDTKKSALQWAMDILRPARVYPVLQGNTWKFVIDQAVTLSSCPVIYEDTSAQRVVRESVRLMHDSQARIPTELQTRYLDEDEEFEYREVWVAPETPTDTRRVIQAGLVGITRRSEATRATNALYKQMTAGGLSLEFLQSPGAINYEAGDVVRFISSRMGIDGYWRIARMEWGTKDQFFVKVQGLPYIPAVYGQQDAAQSTPTTGTTQQAPPPPIFVTRQPTDTRSGNRRAGDRRTTRVSMRVRRVA